MGFMALLSIKRCSSKFIENAYPVRVNKPIAIGKATKYPESLFTEKSLGREVIQRYFIEAIGANESC
jgi:hypothetical protein